ncbi:MULTISPECIES: ParB family protein [unclassified Vibrio]|uniref:ParB family protein n=1 Tax=unclassified Vibrio TaxID=2614977 RepID=UPI0012678908|nr:MULTISPECIES: ParB family protein [unclassified Vibrio]QFT39974.1 Virulence regulon transcriptional activator VirB [Vibrio sp. THAF64]QGM37901.1 Virulence regulon transcriptional activator VirB [Vibrio sp. THAF191d]QGN73244.1 Virulence regulon transcriptional activator VirB [Vibrio sp. THAF191c]
MAKKRGAISPLGNTVGSEEAKKNAAKATLESLTRQLDVELENAGESAQMFLQRHFGMESVGKSVDWRLNSGRHVSFNEVTLTYEQVLDETVVTFDVNGRDQSLLTKASLTDLNSLAFQQFYPAVGREVDGKIDILDGSRRRAWFLLQQGEVATFRVLVTKESITTSEAKALAKQLQSAKEHNPREIGLQCLAIMQTDDCTQEDAAQILGISRQAVGRALKAARIDARLIALFPVVNDLSHTDYALLDKVMKAFQSDDAGLAAFIAQLTEQLSVSDWSQVDLTTKEWLIQRITTELKIVTAKQVDASVSVTQLKAFSSSAQFARKRVKGRNFSYEFGRLPKSVQQALDDAICQVLDGYQED